MSIYFWVSEFRQPWTIDRRQLLTVGVDGSVAWSSCCSSGMFFEFSPLSMPPFVFGFPPPFFFLPFFDFAPVGGENCQFNEGNPRGIKQHQPGGLEAVVFAGILYDLKT